MAVTITAGMTTAMASATAAVHLFEMLKGNYLTWAAVARSDWRASAF